MRWTLKSSVCIGVLRLAEGVLIFPHTLLLAVAVLLAVVLTHLVVLVDRLLVLPGGDVAQATAQATVPSSHIILMAEVPPVHPVQLQEQWDNRSLSSFQSLPDEE